MQQRFIDYIEQNQLLKKGDKILLAISGGIDSMVMANLFHLSAINFGIAHCNFLLRGKDSDQDEAFVRKAAETFQVPFFSKRFQTTEFAKQEKQSIQMAARALRYEWLEQIRSENAFEWVATAHHLDDSIETLFLNITRGTGISGLTGIPKKNKKVIRPLLFATKKEISNFAKKHQIRFREDRSNKESSYQRNKIRHQLIPLLQELNPAFPDNMTDFFRHMEATEKLYQVTLDKFRQTCIHYHHKETHIIIKELLKLPHPETILFELIKEYNFQPSQNRDVFDAITGQPGKRFFSDTHKLIKDRETLIIISLKENNNQETVLVFPDTKEIRMGQQSFQFKTGALKSEQTLPRDATSLLADMEKLHFPLLLRHWQAGDYIRPLGLKGKKKISDLLIDEKIPLHHKKEVLVLVSGKEVVWVPGLRVSEKTKITKNSKNYFFATLTG